jgi:hypothetical protein
MGSIRKRGRRTTNTLKASNDTVVCDSVPERDYVSQAAGLGPTTLWSRALGVSARETADTGTQYEKYSRTTV